MQSVPHNPASERAAIAAAITDASWAGDLRMGWFWVEENAELASVILGLDSHNVAVNLDTVSQKLGREQLVYLGTEVMDSCHSPSNFGVWAAELEQLRICRELLRQANAFAGRVMGGEHSEEVTTAFQGEVLATGMDRDNGEYDPQDLIEQIQAQWAQAMLEPGTLAGLGTGLGRLDRVTGGMGRGQLVVLAARPGIGKTSLALQVGALHNAGFFSLEMGAAELLKRLVCSQAGVSSQEADQGFIKEPEVHKLAVASQQVARLPLHIDDRSSLTVAQIRAQARRWRGKHGINLVVVDYLQLLGSDGGRTQDNRATEVARISGGLKGLARELELPVLCLSQLSRAGEAARRAPILSDLRDSGSIEQDADQVWFLHEPEPDPEAVVRKVDCHVAKNRNGARGMVHLRFRPEFTAFREAIDNDEDQEEELTAL